MSYQESIYDPAHRVADAVNVWNDRTYVDLSEKAYAAISRSKGLMQKPSNPCWAAERKGAAL